MTLMVAALACVDPGPGASTRLASSGGVAGPHEISLRVVKIVTADETGAGLVVGTSGDHLIIATALHVVRPADAPASGDAGGTDVCPSTGALSIAFQNQTTPLAGATLVACRGQVDLALLDLPAPEMAHLMADGPTLCYQDPQKQEQANVIGHASGDWTVSSVDAILADSFEGDSRRFILTGHGSDRGASGGPVLNDRPCLLGIFTTHAALGSRATSARELLSFASSVPAPDEPDWRHRPVQSHGSSGRFRGRVEDVERLPLSDGGGGRVLPAQEASRTGGPQGDDRLQRVVPALVSAADGATGVDPDAMGRCARERLRARHHSPLLAAQQRHLQPARRHRRVARSQQEALEG